MWVPVQNQTKSTRIPDKRGVTYGCRRRLNLDDSASCHDPFNLLERAQGASTYMFGTTKTGAYVS